MNKKIIYVVITVIVVCAGVIIGKNIIKDEETVETSKNYKNEESKNTVLDAFPELVEKSMALAAKNMHKKDKFFEINALKEATTEIVTNRPWPVGLKVYE